MEGIHNLKQIYSSNRFGPIIQKFASDFIHDHYLILIGLMLVLISSLFYRKWSSFILVAGAFVGYTLLVHISYPNNPVKFYYENLLLPLSIFILTPLIFQVLPSKNVQVHLDHSGAHLHFSSFRYPAIAYTLHRACGLDEKLYSGGKTRWGIEAYRRRQRSPDGHPIDDLGNSV